MKIILESSWFDASANSLCGNKCANCGKVHFPKKEICSECSHDQLSNVSLSKKGILHTFAISYLGIPGIEIPYAMGFIDLPEKIKIFSMLTDCKPWDEKLKIGMEMEMVMGVIRRDEHGNEILSYQFRPVTET
jgi:uncharacterized OB-fold protein